MPAARGPRPRPHLAVPPAAQQARERAPRTVASTGQCGRQRPGDPTRLRHEDLTPAPRRPNPAAARGPHPGVQGLACRGDVGAPKAVQQVLQLAAEGLGIKRTRGAARLALCCACAECGRADSHQQPVRRALLGGGVLHEVLPHCREGRQAGRRAGGSSVRHQQCHGVYVWERQASWQPRHSQHWREPLVRQLPVRREAAAHTVAQRT